MTFFLLLLQASAAADPAALVQQGRLPEAEREISARLTRAPADPRLLMLMAVVLDSQKRYEEAEPYYRRAAQAAPKAAPVWNNFGNHWVARGRLDDARKAFAQAVAIDAAHPNAHVQLARIAVQQGRAADALPHLQRLRAEESQDPALLVLLGRALAAKRDYAAAERAFASALERAPGDFDIRLALGFATLHAGDTTRALSIFEVARGQQPSNPDVLYGLARAYVEQEQIERALVLLAELRRLAPQREDVLALLARTASMAGFHADAARAWEDYLKLQPASKDAMRERAFSLVRAGDKQGVPQLEAYVRKHPKDAVGQFELGVAYTLDDLPKAIKQLDRAIAMAPDFAEASFVRGTLLLKDGKPELAAADLERAVKLTPENAKALDGLGQAYRTLGRKEEAERLLRKAAELAPNDGPIAMHLALALRDNGKREESQKYFARFRELGGEQRRPPARGLLDFLSLAPDQRREQYVANLRQALEEQPGNEEVRVRLGSALIERGEASQGEAVLAELKSAARIDEAGRALIQSGHYASAAKLLTRRSLDRAVALFHTAGADRGLAALDEISQAERDGDYWLARAQMLEAKGSFEPAVEALNKALAAAPARPDLYHEAMRTLVDHGRLQEANALTADAARRLPDDPQLQLDRALVLELSGDFEGARAILAALQRRWPEWARPYTLHGISFMARSKGADALPLLETAASLGDDSPELQFYLAEALASLGQRDRALAAVTRAVELSPDDPYARSLAGRLHLEAGRHKEALEQLQRSIELLPNHAQAHYHLMRVYSAMGDKEQAKLHAGIAAKLRSEGKDVDSVLRLPAR